MTPHPAEEFEPDALEPQDEAEDWDEETLGLDWDEADAQSVMREVIPLREFGDWR